MNPKILWQVLDSLLQFLRGALKAHTWYEGILPSESSNVLMLQPDWDDNGKYISIASRVKLIIVLFHLRYMKDFVCLMKSRNTKVSVTMQS